MMQKISSFFSKFSSNIPFLDIIIVCIVLFYVREGYSLGFALAFVDLISFIISFIAALQFYTYVSTFLSTFFAMPIGIAHAVSFFIVATVSEVILAILFRKLAHRIPPLPRGNPILQFLKNADHWLGIFPGIISAFIILSFLLTIIVTFPSSPFIKEAVNNSSIASRLVLNTSMVEKQLDGLFGGALSDTLNFLTVEEKSDKVVQLHFKVASGSIDEKAEAEMLSLVNSERGKQGLSPLFLDEALRGVARAHSNDMFANGYFSHQSLDGHSPFDRMEDAGIKFEYAGENLALAPTTPLAMQGLMNSPGHRANILSPHFNKVGIGVIDGGIYGKMYSQEFSN